VGVGVGAIPAMDGSKRSAAHTTHTATRYYE
jgi:hypothetical protein